MSFTYTFIHALEFGCGGACVLGEEVTVMGLSEGLLRFGGDGISTTSVPSPS